MSPAPRAWLLGWLAGPLLGIANGAARDTLYARRLGEARAQRVSTATLICLLGGWFVFLQRRRPIASGAEAARIGGTWCALTVLFELVLGRVLGKRSWSELAGAYDVRKGRLWVLVPLWTAVGPAVSRALMARRPTQPRRCGAPRARAAGRRR